MFPEDLPALCVQTVKHCQRSNGEKTIPHHQRSTDRTPRNREACLLRPEARHKRSPRGFPICCIDGYHNLLVTPPIHRVESALIVKNRRKPVSQLTTPQLSRATFGPVETQGSGRSREISLGSTPLRPLGKSRSGEGRRDENHQEQVHIHHGSTGAAGLHVGLL